MELVRLYAIMLALLIMVFVLGYNLAEDENVKQHCSIKNTVENQKWEMKASPIRR